MTHIDELSDPDDSSFDESDMDAAQDRIADKFLEDERDKIVEILRSGDPLEFTKLAQKFERALVDDCEEARRGGYRDPDED